MRKLISAVTLLFLSQLSMGQAVSDNAVIPVSVTLNSILRLSVVSGGNIQFVVNTIDDYTNGIPNGARYTTEFTVASSRNFDVLMYSESANLIGTDAGGTMPLNNIGFEVPDNGNGATSFPFDIGTVGALTDVATTQIAVGCPAGGSAANTFQILWRLGTTEGSMNAQTLLEQSITPDNYVTNVFLVVDPN